MTPAEKRAILGKVTGDEGRGGPELREEMPAGSPVTGNKSVEISKFRWNHGLKLSSP